MESESTSMSVHPTLARSNAGRSNAAIATGSVIFATTVILITILTIVLIAVFLKRKKLKMFHINDTDQGSYCGDEQLKAVCHSKALLPTFTNPVYGGNHCYIVSYFFIQ